MKNSKSNKSFVRALKCSVTGQTFDHDRYHGLSQCGAPLLVDYDLGALRQALDRDEVASRPPDIWMWWEFLPMEPETIPVSLGEAVTPLIPLDTAGQVLIKDEGRLPTGSFKARGMAMAITMARHFGKSVLAVPTAGNAGAAAAAYGASAGMDVHVFTPIDTPDVTVREISFHGAKITHVDGLIDLCGKQARAAVAKFGWLDMSTLAEPYRLEGKKTMGLELALQFGWSLPDVIYYPTGGGTGFIGMWKAFRELQALGWIGKKLPRMVSVQTTGCNPIQVAFEAGHEDIQTAFSPVDTVVPGVRVPKPLGGRLILQVLRESGGHACAVTDHSALSRRDEIAANQGISLCPEGSACVATYYEDITAGRISPSQTVVIFNTASGLKWPMPDVKIG